MNIFRSKPFVFSCALIAATAMLGGCSGGDESMDESIIDNESEALDEFSMDGKGIKVVRLNFDVGGDAGEQFPKSIPNLGASDVKASVVERIPDGGTGALIGKPPGKNGRSIDLPKFNGEETGPRAVVKVVDNNPDNGDALSPGKDDFVFGADFNLDELNSDPKDSDDNGNNVIQRGLHGSGHQYKIQVDKVSEVWKPSCTLSQCDGKDCEDPCKVKQEQDDAVCVTANDSIKDSRWYRVTCIRKGTTLKLVVRPYVNRVLQDPISTGEEKNIPDIDLTWPAPGPGKLGVPMSIGGKLKADGEIVDKSSDQFNGFIDNAFLTIFR
jgi:hypothetical protein